MSATILLTRLGYLTQTKGVLGIYKCVTFVYIVDDSLVYPGFLFRGRGLQ